MRFTKIELELFTENEMYEFCEQGIRGGLSQISIFFFSKTRDELQLPAEQANEVIQAGVLEAIYLLLKGSPAP